MTSLTNRPPRISARLLIVKQNVNYYADAAEWYVDDLIKKDPELMTREELFHLSHLYTELGDAAPSSE